MYCEFFGLSVAPFNNTPDPRFFFNTPDHEEALASLVYAAQERKGFVLVTGEVGAGKTLLSRLLLSRLSAVTRTAFVTNTRVSGRELLLAVCRDFKIAVSAEMAASELAHALQEFLLEQYARDRLAVLVVDEAQNLPLEVFEEIRMLGNLEADNAKLLQVLILGQPELQHAFRQPAMRQLYQRICRTFHLRALSAELTEQYIAHRLRVAGLPESYFIFDRSAAERIHHHSEGIPRLINQICDNALLSAYTESRRHVDARVIDDVVEQLMSLPPPSVSSAPRGEFARRLLGETTEEPARPRVADRPTPAAHEAPTVQPPATVDADVRRLTDRTALAERRLNDVEARLRDLFTRAETADTQAARIIEDARHSAGRFREQAETLLRRAGTAAETVRMEGETLRTDIARQVEDFREQVHAARKECADSREASEELLRQAAEKGRASQENAQALLHRAEAIHSQTQKLLQMPRELIDEAHAGAAELKKMSAKVATVIRHLSEAHAQAQQTKTTIAEASAAADERTLQLRRQTEQVGRLVTIVRQLYRAMDTRIERLRERLEHADDLSRTVPREIEGLRRALTGEIDNDLLPTIGDPVPRTWRAEPAASARQTRPAPKRSPASGRNPARRALATSRPLTVDRKTLASMGEGNDALSEWIRQTLDGAEAGGATRPEPATRSASGPAALRPAKAG